ncbi:MAG: cytochrome c biogenesis protein CcdA [Balneolales bacterium]
MHLFSRTGIVAGIFLLLQIFFIQAAAAQPMSSADRVVTGTKLSVDKVKAGSEFKAAVILNIEDSWHVNANQPSLDYLIGTELALEPHDEFIIADIRYPEPDSYEFAFADGEELLVYEEEVAIFVAFRASSSLEPGEHLIEGSLRVQACDDQTCLAPADVSIRIPVTVAADDAGPESRNDELFNKYEASISGPSSGGIGTGNDIAAIFENGGGLVAFLAIFLIGLALNLTPCVYPMLSVTVSIFGSQTEKRGGVIFSKALLYVLGIATMYSGLGVAAAFSGGLFGAWLQSPAILAAIGILFLGLALSMFGLYELQMPYWITKRLGSSNSTGFFGTYISGLVVGIFAAPCIGPPIIALLAFVGTQGDPVFGFWAFFILSLGLGLPYLVLGTFTGLIQKMPKSGLWMVWVKKVFGVILIGLAFFYIGLALYPQYVLYVIPVTLVLGGFYLGFIDKDGKGKPIFTRVKYAIGAGAVVFGMLFTLNLQKESMVWEEYSDQRFEEAVQQGKPILMDFYADWCIPCLELDRMTFTDPSVINATDDMVKLKVDLTHFGSPESEHLRREYSVAGVPSIVFINESGEEVRDARVVGFLNPEEFMKRIEMVGPDHVVVQ